MNVTSVKGDKDATSATARERWDNEGASPRSTSHPVPGAASPGPGALTPTVPFPKLDVGTHVLNEVELVRLVDKPTLGKYRVQQAGLGEAGLVFLVTLFGSTCSKVEIVSGKKPDWNDYLEAMKRAIERECGYWQNRGLPLSPDAQRSIAVTVRETDFAAG